MIQDTASVFPKAPTELTLVDRLTEICSTALLVDRLTEICSTEVR